MQTKKNLSFSWTNIKKNSIKSLIKTNQTQVLGWPPQTAPGQEVKTKVIIYSSVMYLLRFQMITDKSCCVVDLQADLLNIITKREILPKIKI